MDMVWSVKISDHAHPYTHIWALYIMTCVIYTQNSRQENYVDQTYFCLIILFYQIANNYEPAIFNQTTIDGKILKDHSYNEKIIIMDEVSKNLK